MANPDYSQGKHSWPNSYSIPAGCSPIGFDDGLAYFFNERQEICTLPISILGTLVESGNFAGLAELAASGVAIADLHEVDITNQFNTKLA